MNSKRRTFTFPFIIYVSYSCFVLLLPIIYVVGASASKTNSKSKLAVSPIKNWDPSWTASGAQGTTVALSCPIGDEQQERGILILIRSKKSDTTAKSNTQVSLAKKEVTKLGGLDLCPVNSNELTMADASCRWTLLGSSALCCMTGFSSDVDYLTRRLQFQVEQNTIVYDSDFKQPVRRMVHLLAEILQSATQQEGDRPFGVQVMMIGQQPQPQSKPRSESKPLAMFTLDPSGGYRHWGVGTAIGKAATHVRKQMYELLVQTAPTSAESALRMALNATMSAMNDEGSANNGASSQYEAILVWNVNGGLRAAIVDPKQVEDVRQSLLKQEQNKSDDKTTS